MRTALVYPETPGRLAGNVDAAAIRSYVRNLSCELEDQGHEVTVQALDGDPVRNAGSAVTKLADSLSKTRPDVVHAHLWVSGLASVAAVRRARDLEQISVVLTPHSVDLPGPDQQSTRKWLRLKAAVARDADRITVSSGRDRADLIKLGVRHRAIDVIPHGVDTQKFTPDDAELTHGSAPQVLAVGPLSPQTGLATAIEALPFLPGVKLTLAVGPSAGQPSPWEIASDKEAARLNAVACDLGVGDRTSIVEMPEREDLPDLLRSADVVVSTPWHESPNSVEIEAMACGRPVVGAAVGELPEVIIEGTTGVLVPPRSPRDLARALRELLTDPIRLNGYAMASTQRASARYAWPRVAREVAHAYESAIDG